MDIRTIHITRLAWKLTVLLVLSMHTHKLVDAVATRIEAATYAEPGSVTTPPVEIGTAQGIEVNDASQ